MVGGGGVPEAGHEVGFGLDGGDAGAGEGEVVDDDGRPLRLLVVLRVPDRAHLAVDEDGALVGADVGGCEAAVVVGPEAGAVGASGRSNSSRPRSSRNTRSWGRSRSNTSRIAFSRDHVDMSAGVAGPKAAR